MLSGAVSLLWAPRGDNRTHLLVNPRHPSWIPWRSRRNSVPFTQHLPLFLLCGNCKLANLSMGSSELAVSPGFIGNEKEMLIFFFFLFALLFLLPSPRGCICILRGGHFFLGLVATSRVDFLMFCCAQSLLVELMSFVGSPPLWSSPTVGLSLLIFIAADALGGRGSGGAAEETSTLSL